MKKPSVPDIPPMENRALRRVVQALKENTEIVTGRRGRIAPLASDATTSQIIFKINEVLSRLQD